MIDDARFFSSLHAVAVVTEINTINVPRSDAFFGTLVLFQKYSFRRNPLFQSFVVQIAYSFLNNLRSRLLSLIKKKLHIFDINCELFQKMDTVDGCRHLREYKEEEGLDAYKTVHAWFATPVSAAARRFL